MYFLKYVWMAIALCSLLACSRAEKSYERSSILSKRSSAFNAILSEADKQSLSECEFLSIPIVVATIINIECLFQFSLTDTAKARGPLGIFNFSFPPIHLKNDVVEHEHVAQQLRRSPLLRDGDNAGLLYVNSIDILFKSDGKIAAPKTIQLENPLSGNISAEGDVDELANMLFSLPPIQLTCVNDSVLRAQWLLVVKLSKYYPFEASAKTGMPFAAIIAQPNEADKNSSQPMTLKLVPNEYFVE